MRDQGVSDQKLCLSRSGDTTASAGTDGELEVAWTSVSSQPVDWLSFFCSNQSILLLSLCVKVCSAGRGERTYLREYSQIWPDIQGFCSRNLGPYPAPNRTVKATEKNKVSASHLASDLAPPNSPGDSCWHTLRKDVNCGLSNPAPPLHHSLLCMVQTVQ